MPHRAILAASHRVLAPLVLAAASSRPRPCPPLRPRLWANASAGAVSLEGWLLRDRAGNIFALGGQIGPGARRAIVLPAGKLPLNNDGDSVSLLDAAGETVHHVGYAAGEAGAGARIAF